MKTKIKVSIIVPVYNVERYLPRCLDSLLNQTLKQIEIICVDDCSADGCKQIVKEYMELDTRVVLVENASNIGLGLTRNEGLKIAKGKYVGFVDSDDYVDPDMFMRLFQWAEETQADLVDSNFVEIFDSGNEYHRGCCLAYRTFSSEMQEESIKALLVHDVHHINISVCTKIYNRSFLSMHDILFQSERLLLAEDLMFNLSVLVNTRRISTVSDSFYFYCVRSGSLIQSYKRDMLTRIIELHHSIEKLLYNSKLQLKYQLDIRRGFLRMVFLCLNNEWKANDPLRTKLNRINQILRNKDVIQICKDIPYKRMPRSKKTLVNVFRFFVLLAIKLKFIR